MEYTTDSRPLTTVQKCVVLALAAGSTITAAAEANGIQRITIYRWMKTRKEFSAALHRARAEFVLASRDKLYHLSNRALDTLLTVLDNPKSSPAVLLRTSVFTLQRPQMPKTGWSMPEPSPDPDGKKLLDSAIIEQDYDNLPGLYNIERDDPAETGAPAESAPPEPPPPAESPVPPPLDPAECIEMLHDSPDYEDVAPAAGDPAPAASSNGRQTGLRSCPAPPAVPKARHSHAKHFEILDMIGSVDAARRPKIEKEDPETGKIMT
jgi:uncharacterized protein (DUF1778 family)